MEVLESVKNTSAPWVPEDELMERLGIIKVDIKKVDIKNIEDIEGDRKEKAATLPVKYGIKPALVSATVLLVILISITFVAIKYAVYSSAFMYIVIIADFLMLFSAVAVWFDSSAKNMRRVSNDLKLSMVIGLLAIIAGSV